MGAEIMLFVAVLFLMMVTLIVGGVAAMVWAFRKARREQRETREALTRASRAPQWTEDQL